MIWTCSDTYRYEFEGIPIFTLFYNYSFLGPLKVNHYSGPFTSNWQLFYLNRRWNTNIHIFLPTRANWRAVNLTTPSWAPLRLTSIQAHPSLSDWQLLDLNQWWSTIIFLPTKANWRAVNLTIPSWAQWRLTSTQAHPSATDWQLSCLNLRWRKSFLYFCQLGQIDGQSA